MDGAGVAVVVCKGTTKILLKLVNAAQIVAVCGDFMVEGVRAGVGDGMLVTHGGHAPVVLGDLVLLALKDNGGDRQTA